MWSIDCLSVTEGSLRRRAMMPNLSGRNRGGRLLTNGAVIFIGGGASSALATLFTSGAWAVAGGLVQPLFTAGRTKSQVALEKARTEEAALIYQQTIQQAFREVSDALVGYRRSRELRATQELLVRSAQDALRLAEVRSRGGATSYLEVLDSDTRLFSAQLDLVQAQFNELAAFVEIYRAMGGGWQS